MDLRLSEATGVLVETPRDEWVLSYIVAFKGEVAVRDVVSQLAGQRKAYVSNVLKISGIVKA